MKRVALVSGGVFNNQMNATCNEGKLLGVVVEHDRRPHCG
jgi:hypothetical protein